MFLPTTITLKPGDVGMFVEALQRRLVNKGFLGEANISGDYDLPTSHAVRNFQASNGLRADGIAGPRTLRLLNGGFANTNPDEERNALGAAAVVATYVVTEALLEEMERKNAEPARANPETDDLSKAGLGPVLPGRNDPILTREAQAAPGLKDRQALLRESVSPEALLRGEAFVNAERRVAASGDRTATERLAQLEKHAIAQGLTPEQFAAARANAPAQQAPQAAQLAEQQARAAPAAEKLPQSEERKGAAIRTSEGAVRVADQVTARMDAPVLKSTEQMEAELKHLRAARATEMKGGDTKALHDARTHDIRAVKQEIAHKESLAGLKEQEAPQSRPEERIKAERGETPRKENDKDIRQAAVEKHDRAEKPRDEVMPGRKEEKREDRLEDRAAKAREEADRLAARAEEKGTDKAQQRAEQADRRADRAEQKLEKAQEKSPEREEPAPRRSLESMGLGARDAGIKMDREADSAAVAAPSTPNMKQPAPDLGRRS